MSDSAESTSACLGDGALLRAFLADRHQAAFEDLVRRHGGSAGITSSAAAAEAAADTQGKTGLTGISITSNTKLDQFGNVSGPLKTLSKGQNGLDTNAVLAAFTLNGDANLDGTITFDDYFRINTGFLSNGAKTGYWNGDFNFDALINFDDYFMINTAFLGQNSHTPLPPMAKTMSPFSTKKVAPARVVKKLRAHRRAGMLASLATSLFISERANI